MNCREEEMLSGDERGEEGVSDMARIVDLIVKIGPNISEISRRTKIYKETVRYRYKTFLLKRGFAIHAVVDHEALGLRRIVLKIRFTSEYKPFAEQILVAMHKLCYVVGYSKVLPNDVFLVRASVPVEHKAKFRQFVGKLREMRIFERVDWYDFEWLRVVPMRGELFDFDHGVWDFDWSNPPQAPPEAMRSAPSGLRPFDRIDLLMLKELTKNADRTLMEVGEAIRTINHVDINYKTLVWHFVSHVKQGLISGYAVKWIGTNFDFVSEKSKQRQHKYLAVVVLVSGVDETEKLSLMGKMNKLPFLWNEAVGQDYYVEFAFPLDTVNEAMEYLRDALEPFGERASMLIADQRSAVNFTISYHLYDEEKKRWGFEKEELLARFENLALSLRSSA